MQFKQFLGCTTLGVMITAANPALAYVGPGAGLSAIGSVLAFLGIIVLTVLGFFWYPLKRMIKGSRRGPSAEATEIADDL